jgi:hypothetical protein
MRRLTPKGKRFFLIIAGIFVILLFVVILFVMKPAEDLEFFYGREQLDNVMGSGVGSEVLEIIENYVLSDSEKETAPHENRPTGNLPKSSYNGTISDFAPVQKILDEQELSVLPYNFKLSISDGREYYIYTLMDAVGVYSPLSVSYPIAQQYMAVLFTRLDTDSKPYLHIVQTKKYSSFDAELSSWLDMIGFKKDDVEIKDDNKYYKDSSGEFQNYTDYSVIRSDEFKFYSDTSEIVTITENNTPQMTSNELLPPLKTGDKVKLYYACSPSVGSPNIDACLVYGYDLYK